MRRKEFMNVNEERLKEIMAHETDADGCPKTHPDGIEKEEDRGKEETESVSIPDGRTEKPTVFHKPAVRSGTSLAERMKTYRADYLSRREYVHRKQTYISYETYRRLARILPLLSEGTQFGQCYILQHRYVQSCIRVLRSNLSQNMPRLPLPKV